MRTSPRPFHPIPPGNLLRRELDARGWTQTEFAEIIGRPIQTVNEIIKGKKAITAPTARLLSQVLGTTAEYWLNLQAAYELDKLPAAASAFERRAAIGAVVPLKELQRRGWIESTDDVDRLERKVCEFLGVQSLSEQPKPALAARKSRVYLAAQQSAILAWASRATQLARRKKVRGFSTARFKKAVADMPRLSASSQGTRRIPEVLGDLGIRFVIVEHLRKTYVDGATFWLDRRSPVVALSLRYDRVDNFWFTLMHELAHVLQGYRTQGFIDDYLVGKDAAQTEDKPEIEQEADHLASEWLVPRGTLAAFIAANHPYYSKEVVEAFAREISVHPGIVVGRLQNMGKMPYANLRGLLTKVREHFS